MEELFVYAILCGVGFEKYGKYEDTLERLLEWNPTDEMLLDLYGRKYKDALLHIHSIMNESALDCEPFHILSYADDCLSYGDEKQCRELYESMFAFYEQ